ncbi:MAG TPA: serine hydrolase [Chitinophagaceae bacterium]|nr:serine hydrolase [Chitinophagaceae bacterium]
MKKIGAALLCSFILACACAQSDVPSFVKDSLDIYVNRALTNWQIPGVAVCVVKNGKVVLMRGYGVKEAGTTDKVDENTLFMIGSNTKAFTATALAMLETEKKLTLDDKVQKWLPDFKLYDPWVAKEASIRDLLCHRLGFETFQGDFMFFDSDLSTAEMRERLGRLKPLYGFRSRWGYTNAAFMTAGEIIPKASGKTWAEYLTEKIFVPLGMNNTMALTKNIATAPNKALPHTVWMNELKKIPYGRIDAMAPAGSIASSVNDMSKWVMAQLDRGKLDGKEIIPPAAIARTWVPHSILGNGGVRFNNGHFALYGLGWFLEEYNGKRITSHTGGVNGFVTSVTLIPEEKLGIVVLTNTDANGFYESLKWELMDAYMGLPYRDYSAVMLAEHKANEAASAKNIALKRDTINTKPAPALPLNAYAGEYEHELYGKMNITLEKGELIMRFAHHSGRYSKLEALGGNRFLSTWNDPIYGVKVLPFTVENNKVKSLTVRVADFVEFTPYEFVKVK